MKRVLVTGARGFIGSHLCEHLSQLGFQIHRVVKPNSENLSAQVHSCDLTNYGEVSTLFRKVEPDFLIHLAAHAQPGRNMDELPIQYQRTILPALTVAQAAPQSLELAMFVGSCEEYGNGPVPFYEDQAPVCFSPYGWGKISAYYGTSIVAAQRGLSWCWVRPFLTFGPGQLGNQLIPTLIRECKLGNRIPLSLGEQTRDFIYVEDICRMIATIMDNPRKALNKTINLCTGVPHRVRDVAELVRNLIGKGELQFGSFPYRENEAMMFYGSPDRFRKLFGEPALTPLETALRKTVQFGA